MILDFAFWNQISPGYILTSNVWKLPFLHILTIFDSVEISNFFIPFVHFLLFSSSFLFHLLLFLFSCEVIFDILWCHGLQHARLLCPPVSPEVCSNSCPLSQWCNPTISSSSSPFTFNLSQHQGLFQWVGSLYQVAKDWSFSFNLSPSNEYSGLISFRIDCFDILAIHGTLKSLLQHHNQKLQFFGAQPSLWSSSYISTWLLEKS